MSYLAAASTPRSTALRVFGTIGAVVATMLVAAAIVKPDMLMSAVHAVMGMMR